MQTEFSLFSEPVVIMQEEWKTVVGFPGYEVSTVGRFRNKRTGKYLCGTAVHNGYQHIGLMLGGVQVTKLSHRLIAETFLEKPSEKHSDVNHKNKIRSDNRVTNLEWSTRSYNSKHARAR